MLADALLALRAALRAAVTACAAAAAPSGLSEEQAANGQGIADQLSRLFPPPTVTDALLALHAAANACAAATPSGCSVEQAADAQAVVDDLRSLFRPRPAVATHTAQEPDAPLLTLLPREIVLAILHRLETRDLARFAATCQALYRHAPPQQESLVAVALQERAQNRGCCVGPFGVPDLLRREWQRTLEDRPPLLASMEDGQMSAFIDSGGHLLTCGTEGVLRDNPGLLSEWVDATADPEHEAHRRVLATPTIVPAMRDVFFRGVAFGGDRCFAVSRAGRVYTWGAEGGHLGHDEEAGTEVDGLAGVGVRSLGMGLSTVNTAFAAVSALGSLYTWGHFIALDGGPSGIGYPASETDGETVQVPRQVILSGVFVRSVALGSDFSLILADDGRLLSCGCAQDGVLGHGNAEHDLVRPKHIEALQGVRVCGVAADYSNSLALTTDGRVFSWGLALRTGHGHAGPVDAVLLPTLVEALANETVGIVAAGGGHACVVTQVGGLFTWGSDGDFGSLGHGDIAAQHTPQRVEALRGCRIATVAMGDYHTLAAAEDGSVYGFGLSSLLGLGTVSHESQLTPVRIPNIKVCVG